jgi:hypothetical protein
MVFRIECILAPPAELELAQGTLHELATTTALDEARAPGTQLTPNNLIQVRQERQLSRQVRSEAEYASLESHLLINTPSVSALRALVALNTTLCTGETK